MRVTHPGYGEEIVQTANASYGGGENRGSMKGEAESSILSSGTILSYTQFIVYLQSLNCQKIQIQNRPF